MKKLLLFILVLAIPLGLCSCKESAHRKLEFEDGECYCFNGACGVYDEYISLGGGSVISGVYKEYVSINNRGYTITKCYCDNID